jgi:hypothetical protein
MQRHDGLARARGTRKVEGRQIDCFQSAYCTISKARYISYSIREPYPPGISSHWPEALL